MAEMMVGKDRDEESGQYTDTYPKEMFLDVLRELGGGGTRKIAEQVGCHRDTARRRLNTFVEEGEVRRQEVGDSALWTVREDSNE